MLDVMQALKGGDQCGSDVIAAAPGQNPQDEVGLLEHSFPLRRDFSLTIELPENLTTNEACRLAAFIQSLPFGEED